MNLDGSAVLHADPERVWSVITDPAVLARTIPGCESLEQVGDDEYRMNVSVGVGAIRGTYAGEVQADRPAAAVVLRHARVRVPVRPGNVRATVTINLEPADGGKTTLTYSADAVVGGPVAGVGQRMITGVAKRMAGQFFKAIDDELTGAVVPIAAAPSAAAAGDAALAAAVRRRCAPVVRRQGGRCGRRRSAATSRRCSLGAVGGARADPDRRPGRLPPRPPPLAG